MFVVGCRCLLLFVVWRALLVDFCLSCVTSFCVCGTFTLIISFCFRSSLCAVCCCLLFVLICVAWGVLWIVVRCGISCVLLLVC